MSIGAKIAAAPKTTGDQETRRRTHEDRRKGAGWYFRKNKSAPIFCSPARFLLTS
jgi:hypothetical protein